MDAHPARCARLFSGVGRGRVLRELSLERAPERAVPADDGPLNMRRKPHIYTTRSKLGAWVAIVESPDGNTWVKYFPTWRDLVRWW